MSELERDGGLAAREGVRVHLALVEPDVVSSYLGAAIARVAVDADLSPREAIEKMLDEGVFLGPDEWAPKARELKAFTRLMRQRYSGVIGVYLQNRDASVN